jgi:hypothetical protein
LQNQYLAQFEGEPVAAKVWVTDEAMDDIDALVDYVLEKHVTRVV